MPKKEETAKKTVKKSIKSSKKDKKKVNKDLATKKHGKKYGEKLKLIERKEYLLEEAVGLIKEVSYSKFDGSCELHVNLNINPKKSDQIVRNSIVLPHGTGKKLKIAAFVPDEKKKDAIKAGAYKAGVEDLIDDVKKGNIDFDIAIAEPSVMKDIAKIAKILGQKGLMPNPKAGTVGPAKKLLEEFSKGKIEFKNDKQGVIHTIFGKLSFSEKDLLENVIALIKAILDIKPASIKGIYIKTITLSPTIGPGIRVDINDAIKKVSE